MRFWRGTIDVPPTEESLWEAIDSLRSRLPLDYIYHDKLSRCRRTAEVLEHDFLIETEGSRPWNMGPVFEGKEITEESLDQCREMVKYGGILWEGGECFNDWYYPWINWINNLDSVLDSAKSARVGVVTHNRNIQALYAIHNNVFYPHLYDATGPDFLSVHVYQGGHIARWNGLAVPENIYLIRHAATSYGT